VAALLPYLQDERHIDLMESEFDGLSSSLRDSRGGTVFVLVAAHKNWTGDSIQRSTPTTKCEAGLNEFNETEEAEWRTQLPNESRFGD